MVSDLFVHFLGQVHLRAVTATRSRRDAVHIDSYLFALASTVVLAVRVNFKVQLHLRVNISNVSFYEGSSIFICQMQST